MRIELGPTGSTSSLSSADPFESICSQLRPLKAEDIRWFEARHISLPVLQRNQVQQCMLEDSKGEPHQVFAFVHYDNEDINEIKLRTLDKRWKHYFRKKGRGMLYGINSIKLSSSMIIVEGEIDKMSLDEAGFMNAVSVPDGAPEKVRNEELPAPENDKSFAYLWHSQDVLQQAETILLASDNDPPGHALAEELARRLGRGRCKRVLWGPPPQQAQPGSAQKPCKDANDVLVQHGASAVRHCIAAAQPMPVDGPFSYFRRKGRRGRKEEHATASKAQPGAASTQEQVHEPDHGGPESAALQEPANQSHLHNQTTRS